MNFILTVNRMFVFKLHSNQTRSVRLKDIRPVNQTLSTNHISKATKSLIQFRVSSEFMKDVFQGEPTSSIPSGITGNPMLRAMDCKSNANDKFQIKANLFR